MLSNSRVAVWPSKEVLPRWGTTIDTHEDLLSVGSRPAAMEGSSPAHVFAILIAVPATAWTRTNAFAGWLI